MRSSAPKKLRVLPLAAVIFFTVSGGPYGLEPLLSYSGREAALLLLLITPILWDIPAILTVLELNSMMPCNGGYYAWVKRALGLRFAFYEGWWTWLYTFVDLAIYPVLFVTYAQYFWPDAVHYKIPICLAIIWGGAYLNIRGVSPVGKFSVFLYAFVTLPFIALLATAVSHGGLKVPAPSLSHLGFPALGMSLYTVMWNFFGWDNATTYAEDVENPAKAYLRSIAIAFFAVIILYALTTLVMAGSGIDPAVLRDKGFPALGEAIGGRWLGTIIAAGGLAFGLGLYNAVLLSVSRVPEVMANDRLLPAALNKQHPKWGTPYISIIICAAVVSLMVLWSFEDLIIIDVTLYGAGLFVEFVALIVLRLKAPQEHRPFKIPLPIAGLALMYLLPVCVFAIALTGVFRDSGGGWVPALFAGGALLSAEVIWQAIRLLRRKA